MAHPVEYLRQLKLSKWSISESALDRIGLNLSQARSYLLPPSALAAESRARAHPRAQGFWLILLQLLNVFPSFLPGMYEKIPCACSWRSRFLLNW